MHWAAGATKCSNTCLLERKSNYQVGAQSELMLEKSAVADDGIKRCNCVDCPEDEVCGGLWRANRYPNMPLDNEVFVKMIHIVISHCNKSLNWIPKYTKGFQNIASIHVISKCGVETGVTGSNIEVIRLENVGRCDHTYAYYIANILPQLEKSDDSIVVFVKDSIADKIHQGPIFRRLDLRSMIRLASSDNGFACGIGIVDGGFSAYHDVGQYYI